ncbi:5' nucleotidase, NT5C type [Kurthia huakuii]|uniref:5' nucleotidase, NT5C type n=1 Tax=Kurthia huakuii TaxID=1421019 RepID=UPI000497C7FD|nr:5'-3'-deoxyribonucleotidase [Kurthia huakuii]MBM7698773.1 5'(3')-deoxyribonucleotidase [Kurthia huakuii]
MKRIALDMDQVMADLVAKFLSRFNEEYNKNYTKDDVVGKRLPELDEAAPHALYEYYGDPSFFRDLPVMPHSVEVVERLSEHYEIYIATAAMEVPPSFMAKFEWLQQFFPTIPQHHYVFCGDKSVIHADYLVDDTELQLNRFKNTGVMFAAPHNEHSAYPIRVNDWLELEKFFMTELEKYKEAETELK